MIEFSSKYRSTQAEIMDDFDLKGNEMKLLLTDLKTVNTLLGGCNVTLNGIEKLLNKIPKDKTIKIADIGCGDGEMLRKVADFGNKKGYNFELVGIDANEYILTEARSRSSAYKNIGYKNTNIFSKDFEALDFDIALCTLFLHHFETPKIISFLDTLYAKAKVGVVINDLHRSRWAFELFKLFGAIFLKTKIARHDGLVSVARGFKKTDLHEIQSQVTAQLNMKWKWAFRWQIIIQK